MRNSPKSILIFMLTSLFFVCTAQSQAIIHKHQDLPQWSPDGEKYACVETWLEEGVLESQIRIYRVSGKTETEVAAELFGLGDLAEEKLPEGTVDDDPIVCFFSWAPDSEHYVFTSSTPIGYDLFIGNLSGDVYPFTPSDSEADLFPRWSPNKKGERYIAYMREGKIFLRKIKEEDGKFKPEEKASEILPKGCVESLLPEWSPDGKKLAFSALTEEGNYEIYLYEIDKEEYSRLTDTPEIQEYHPVWSPDGEWIAVYSKHKDAISFGIAIIKADKNNTVTKQIRPEERKNFYISSSEILLVSSVHHSMILGPAWMSSSRHLVYVRPDDNAIMIVEFSQGKKDFDKVDVQNWRVGAITTQLNADVACSPTEAKLLFSHYAPAGGGVAYRNLATHQLKKEKKKFKLEVSSKEQFTKSDSIELGIEGLADNIKMEEIYQRSLSWEMECAVGGVVRGIVECRGYIPKKITIPVLKESIEQSVGLELPEVEIEMWVVNQDYKGIGGVEVFINGDRLRKIEKEEHFTGKPKLRITHPIIDKIIEQKAYKENQTEQTKSTEDQTETYSFPISSEADWLTWGIKSLEIRDSSDRKILSDFEVDISDSDVDINDGVVKKLYIIAKIQMSETKISFLIKNQVDEPIPSINVMLPIQDSEVNTTDGNGIVDLALKELPGTEIKLKFTQSKENKDYKDLDIYFSIPKKDEQLEIHRDSAYGPALVKNEYGRWVVTLDSVVEPNVKITIEDDAGRPLAGMQVYIDGNREETDDSGIIEGWNVRPTSAAFITLKYDDFEYQGKKGWLTLRPSQSEQTSNTSEYEVVLSLPTLFLPIKVQNDFNQPIAPEFVSLFLNDLPLSLTPDGRKVMIKALYGKRYNLAVQIKDGKTFLFDPPRLTGEFQLHFPAKRAPDYPPPYLSWTITPAPGLSGKLLKQGDTLYVQFKTGKLITALQCLYPDGVPIAGKRVAYKGNKIDETDKEGKIKLLLSINDTEGFTVNVGRNKYPLTFSNPFNTQIQPTLSLDSPPKMRIVIKGDKGKKIEDPVNLTTSFGNQPGKPVVKHLGTGKEENLTISRLPGDTVTLSFSKGDNQAKVEVKLKPGGGIKIVKDPRKIVARPRIEEKGNKLVVKHPSNWEKMEQQGQ